MSHSQEQRRIGTQVYLTQRPVFSEHCYYIHVAVSQSKKKFFFFLNLSIRARTFSSADFFFLTFGFIYLFVCWVFVSVRGLSLVVASGGHSSSWCAGLSLSRPLLLQSTGSRRAGSVTVAHGPSCSAACGIFPDQGSNPCPIPDQGSNPCPLHWQADSQPLRHQGSPRRNILSR